MRYDVSIVIMGKALIEYTQDTMGLRSKLAWDYVKSGEQHIIGAKKSWVICSSPPPLIKVLFLEYSLSPKL